MKAHHYLGIVIRLFAIGVFMFSLTQLGYLLENIIYGTVQGLEASAIFSGLIYAPWLLVAIFLWFFPLTVAKKIVPSEAKIEPNAISPRELLPVLLSAIALFLLYRAMMDSIYWATFWNIASASDEFELLNSFSSEHKANIFSTAIEFFVAAMLFFNSRKIAYIASKF